MQENKPFKDILEETLKQNKDFCYQDGESLNTVKLETLALRNDETLLEFLYSKEELKQQFFTPLKNGLLVFKQNDFITYINSKNFLKDSFTSFNNKIGLSTAKNKYLKQDTNVVLNFPFKDCYLQGNQCKDDQKSQEVFYNEILAKDEINKLLDNKVLTNASLVNQEGEKPLTNFKTDTHGQIDNNLLIKGNNLLALHSLKHQFAGKVKLIYIDPPYNTGNDSFNYNDRFNHSSWLVFMKNRLEIARDLLKQDGVIFVQIDDNEQAYLKVLMDEVFGRENFVSNIVWRRTDNQSNIGRIAKVKEYITIFSKNNNDLKFYKLALSDKAKEQYRYSDDKGYFRRNILLDKVKGRHIYSVTNPQGSILTGPWMINEDEFNKLLLSNGIYWASGKDGQPYGKIYLDDKINEGQIPSDFWGIEYGSNQQGARDMQEIFQERRFAFPKPEKLLQNILQISTQPNDLVLDFFAGSGTTPAVAHKMGRRWIAVEQMDYIEDITKERLKKVIGKKQEGKEELEFDNGGVGKAVNWQGGGEFVYLELKQANQEYLNKIHKAQTKEELQEILQILLSHAMGEIKQGQTPSFIKPIDLSGKTSQLDLVDLLEGKSNQLTEQLEYIKQEFAKLTEQAEQEQKQNKKTEKLHKVKELLINLLDKNHLYVNANESEDKMFNCSEVEKRLTTQFYGKR